MCGRTRGHTFPFCEFMIAVNHNMKPRMKIYNIECPGIYVKKF